MMMMMVTMTTMMMMGNLHGFSSPAHSVRKPPDGTDLEDIGDDNDGDNGSDDKN